MKSIKALRENVGMSQKMLAEKIGVERSAVAKWESGVSFPNAAKLPIIAEVLHCNISDLFNQDMNAQEAAQ